MVAQFWSWLLMAVGLTGLWLAGSKKMAGWVLGIAAQALWIAYAVATGQWGFLVSAIAYTVVNTRNLVRWRQEARTADPKTLYPGALRIPDKIDPQALEELKKALAESGRSVPTIRRVSQSDLTRCTAEQHQLIGFDSGTEPREDGRQVWP